VKFALRNTYESPFTTRYASSEMLEIFSPDTKFKTWRKLWIALAEAEKELGLDITDEQIEELKENANNINYEVAEQKERILRHDVMAHIHAYGEQCPKAKGIIHLGATSCYVGDNTDIIIMDSALKLIRTKLVAVISHLSDFAIKYKDLPTLGFTHLQPAQLVTVGKRACLWIQDLMMDLEDLNYILSTSNLLGCKGTTGTQASFLSLFNNDHEKVKKLEILIAKKLGYENVFPVSGQTYTRKQDSRILNVLSGIAQSAYKFSNDMRLLQSLKEIEEPFEEKQVGSSAMAYKRNPMRSERISALARYVIVDALNPAITASTQWFERTLDDSANKRISIPEAFLAVDSILNIYLNISSGLVVYPKMIEKRVKEELPFMATENIMMEAVKRGGDRQNIHEKLRIHSMDAAKQVKLFGNNNDLLQRIANDEPFGMSLQELESLMEPSNYTGRASQQVEEYINEIVLPTIKDIDIQKFKKMDLKV
jgi:adenylosuccinate lyase